jgi:deoxyhypusine synthase
MRNYKYQNQILEDKILVLENKKRENLQDLKLQLETTYQELRPSRLLIRALNDIKNEPEIKTNILESILSITGGFISKKILVGKSHSIFKNLLGYVVQYFTTKIISNNIKH